MGQLYRSWKERGEVDEDKAEDDEGKNEVEMPEEDKNLSNKMIVSV